MNTSVRRAAALLAVATLSSACREPESRAAAPVVATAASEPPPSAVAPQKGPKPALTRLQIRGTQFTRDDGTPVEWRGISAFRLLEMIARGRATEAEAFLDWCSSRDLNVVRVLTMAKHLFALSPDEGRAALPRLLAMAEQRGIYVEIVALADTAEIAMDIDHHVREIGAIAGEHANAIVEIANEPVHQTQVERIHDPAELERLARLVPEVVPVALGAADTDAFAAADYATVHFPRDSGDGGWGHVTALATGLPLLREWRKPLINDEPIGAGDAFDPGRRDNDPERFRAAALLTRMIGMGATFHYDGGLQARVPGGRQLECFDAWQEAWTLLPRESGFAFLQPGADGSPVRSVKGDFARADVAVQGDRAWLLVTRTRGPIEVAWVAGWQPDVKTDWKASLWRSARQTRH